MATSTLPKEQEAAAAFAWLAALDPDGGSRRKLLASGVPKHTVEALYPRSFAAIIPDLCAHLRTYGVRGLRHREEELDQYINDLRSLLPMLPLELSTRYAEDFRVQRGDIEIYRKLRDELQSQFAQAQLEADSYIFTTNAFWYLWWLGTHRAELPEIVWESVDSAAIFFARNILNLPLRTATAAL